MHKIVAQDIKVIITNIGTDINALEGKTVLFTGGSGFLGNYFLAVFQYLNAHQFKKSCTVITVDNNITGSNELFHNTKNSHIISIKHDVRKPLQIKQHVDFLIHAAGIAAPVYYKKYPIEAIEVATIGTKNMLEFARKHKVKSFLFFSSSEIYGDPDPAFIPTPETYRGNVSCVGPRACYDESKRLGETLCMSYYRLYNLPVKIVRPFNVFGPGMKKHDYRVIPAFVANALDKKPLQVHEEGNHTRTYCYISDAVAGILKILVSDRNSEIYNVGTDQMEIRTMSLARLIVTLMKKGEIKKVSYPQSYPHHDPQRRNPDLTKIKTELGYMPKISLETGLERFIAWARDAWVS